VSHLHRADPPWHGTSHRIRWIALVVAGISVTSCSSSSNAKSQPDDASSGDMNVASGDTNMASGDTNVASGDANMASPDASTEAPTGADASPEATVRPTDSGSGRDVATDGAMMCDAFANFQVACSLTCNGNCIDQNGMHIGDCFFTDSRNLLIYCAPWGIMDPCSHCP
jgi:hypothetical protein